MVAGNATHDQGQEDAASELVVEQESYRHADWDRSMRERREIAIRETNNTFGVKLGNGTIDQYNPEQQLFLLKYSLKMNPSLKYRLLPLEMCPMALMNFGLKLDKAEYKIYDQLSKLLVDSISTVNDLSRT